MLIVYVYGNKCSIIHKWIYDFCNRKLALPLSYSFFDNYLLNIPNFNQDIQSILIDESDLFEDDHNLNSIISFIDSKSIQVFDPLSSIYFTLFPRFLFIYKCGMYNKHVHDRLSNLCNLEFNLSNYK